MEPQEFDRQIAQILAVQRQLQEDQIRSHAEIIELREGIAEIRESIVELRGVVSDIQATLNRTSIMAESNAIAIQGLLRVVTSQQDNQEGLQAAFRDLSMRVSRLEQQSLG
jgi:chromosome segregation ATPase